MPRIILKKFQVQGYDHEFVGVTDIQLKLKITKPPMGYH